MGKKNRQVQQQVQQQRVIEAEDVKAISPPTPPPTPPPLPPPPPARAIHFGPLPPGQGGYPTLAKLASVERREDEDVRGGK